MPVRFAHIGDVHLGAFRDPVLRELNLQAFLRCLDVAREEGAAFLVIAGDLFDSNLPEMAVVERAAAGLRELRDSGVAIYAFYGSHDRSPTERGVVDVLASAGLFVNVGVQGPEGDAGAEGVEGAEGDDARRGVQPEPVTDPVTGTVLAAVGGRKLGLESKVLEAMDHDALAGAVAGAPLAVFGFHGAVEGMLPPELGMLESLPPSKLPGGFHYYALGHIHAHRLKRIQGGALAAYPGPTFGATFTDLFDAGPKGMLIVDAGPDGRCEARHVPIEVAPVERLEVDVDGMDSQRAREHVQEAVGSLAPEGRVVLLRVRGTLASGRPADLDLATVGQALLAQGARAFSLNRSGLREAEAPAAGEGGAAAAAAGDGEADPRALSAAVLAAHIESHASPMHWLRGEAGRDVAVRLLDVLRQERGDARRDDHADRIVREALSVLDVERRLSAPTAEGEEEGVAAGAGRRPPEAGGDEGGEGAGASGGVARPGKGVGLDRWTGGGGG